MAKTIEEIQEKLDSGSAIVLTAEELKTKLREGEEITSKDVDVVTCGTSGVMSGTTALLHVPITKPGLFNKAREVYINGIPAYPGPCPNELLGSIDVFLYGTNHSHTKKDYGGGFLLKDLLDGKEVEIKVIDIEGNEFNTKVTLDDFQTARLIGTRMAFKNYNSFTNPDSDSYDNSRLRQKHPHSFFEEKHRISQALFQSRTSVNQATRIPALGCIRQAETKARYKP